MNARAIHQHLLLAAAAIVVLAMPARAVPPVAESRTIEVNFNSDFNDNEIVLGQGAGLTFRVLVSALYGETKDVNNNDVYTDNPDVPYTLPLDASNRAILKYKQSGVTNIAEPDSILFEVENAAGEVSAGVIQVNVKLQPKIEIYSDNPQTNPAAILLGWSNSTDEDQVIAIDTTKIIDDSNSPSDFRTLWTKYSDATGRTTYASGDYLIDNTPPTLTWVAMPNNNATVNGEVAFELSATDNVGVQQVRFEAPLSAVATVLTTPPWAIGYNTVSVPDTTNAPYSFKFEAVDLVNLVSTPRTRSLYVDNTPPTVTDVSLVDNSVLTNLTQITANVGDGTVVILVDGNPVPYAKTPPNIYTLNPPLTAVGDHDVTIRVTDTTGNVTNKTTHVTITGNRNPAAVNDIANTTRDQAIDINVLSNDTDLDGNTLTVQSVGAAGHGTTSINLNKTIHYVPALNYVGNDFFTYVVSDGMGGTATGRVDVGISAGANRAPSAQNDLDQTNEDMAKDITVLSNDSDLDGDTLTVQSVGVAAHGTVSVNGNGTVHYVPAANYNGNDSFTYTISDGQGHLVNGSVSMTIVPVDDDPAVSVQNPNLGPDMSGTFTLNIDPTDDGVITRVEVAIDGGTPRPAIPTGNGDYEFTLDTTPLTDGPHTVTVIVTDNGGNTQRKDVPIDVDNTPVITTPTLDSGVDVSGTHLIDIDPATNTDLDRVLIYVDGTLIATLTDEPFDHPWDTTTHQDGPVDVVIVARDTNGNESIVSRIVDIDNIPDTPVGPQLETFGGNPAENIGGGNITLSIIDTAITDITFVIDGNPMTGSHVAPNRTQKVVDTTKLSDGPHTIYATYTKDGVPASTPIIDYKVDNTAPVATRTKPALDEVVYGPTIIQADVKDAGNNPIDHVDFFLGDLSNKVALVPGHANPSDTLYDFVLDTTKYSDGLYHMFAIPYDKAGNPGGTIVYRFRINNTTPPPAGKITAHPANNAFIVSEDEAQIYATFSGEAISQDYLNANASTIFSVYYEKDGVLSTKLEGIASLQDGKLLFSGKVPENAKVSWGLSVRDTKGQVYEGSYSFTRAMSKSTGGIVTTSDRRFKLQIPADALPMDMFVTITDEQATQGIVSPALGNFESVNPGQSIIAGPFMIKGVDKNNTVIQTISRAALCSYSVPAAQDDQNSPKVFQLAELFDNGKVFPLGSAGPRFSAREADPVGTRSIDVPISRFGRFVITSQVMPEQGLTHFYNFPNPFNPNQGGTDFHYFLGADSTVKIVIYDLFGQEVRNFEIPMGTTGGKLGLNLFTWDGRNGAGEVLANGGYIARVLAQDAQGNHSKASYKIGVLK